MEDDEGMIREDEKKKLCGLVLCLAGIMILDLIHLHMFSESLTQQHYTGTLLFQNLYSRLLLPYLTAFTAWFMCGLLMDTIRFSVPAGRMKKNFLIFFTVFAFLWTISAIVMIIVNMRIIHHPETIPVSALTTDNTFMKYSTPIALLTGAGISVCMEKEKQQDQKIPYLPALIAAVLVIFVVCGGIISYRVANSEVSDTFRHSVDGLFEDTMMVENTENGKTITQKFKTEYQKDRENKEYQAIRKNLSKGDAEYSFSQIR